MESPADEPWSLHLVSKLLHGDSAVLSLFSYNPFPRSPPRYVRVRRFVYRFATPGTRAIWEREYVGPWLPPLDRDDDRLVEFLERSGFRAN
jgi:hypothetical protein